MPFDPASLAVSAGTSVLGPLAGKAIDSLFGGLSQEEKAARANLQRLASGGTSPEDAMLAAQRAKTQSNLAAMAARGTAQQQAGQTRMAMQMAPEIQQQQAAYMAAQKAQRMQEAQRNLATLQQQQGSQQRQFMQNLVGAGLQGGVSLGAMSMMQDKDKAPAAAPAAATPKQPARMIAEPGGEERPYNQGAVNPATGQAQYNVPKPAANAGIVPMTAASQEVASMAKPSAPTGPEFDIGSSNQFTLSPELMPSIGADGGYKAPKLGLGPQSPLAPSLNVGGKQRRALYGYDPLAFQPQMKLGGGY